LEIDLRKLNSKRSVICSDCCSACTEFHFHDSCELRLPFVAVFDELFLVIKELLVKES